MKRHKEYEHTNLKYQCHLCERMIKSKQGIVQHFRTKHKGKDFAFTAVKLHAEVFPDDCSGSYKCDWCDRFFDKKWGLSVHIRRSHTGEKPYRGTYCKELFSDCDTLCKHTTATHTRGRSYKCDLCGKSFILGSDLKKHMTKHVKTPMYTCPRCPEFFEYKAIQVGHVAVAHRSMRPYLCFYCMKEFEETVNLVIHILTNHKAVTEELKTDGNSEEPFRCDACDKTFTSREDLARDILTHMYLKQFRKSSAETRSSSMYSVASTTNDYKTHEEISDTLIKEETKSPSSSTAASDTTELYDNNDYDRMDEETSVKTETKSGGGTENEDKKISGAISVNWIEHKTKSLLPWGTATENIEVPDVSIKEDRGNGEHLVQCRKCKRSFAEIKDLVQHVEEYGADKPNFLLQCRLCNGYFSATLSLQLHLQTHRDKCETFECAVCGKSFDKKAVLEGHMSTHTREKQLQCDHTEEHLSTCKVCAHKRARKQYLAAYVNIRSKIIDRQRPKINTLYPKQKPKKNSCADCKKEFRSKQLLATHRLRHTGERPFECDECDRAFAQKANLTVHKWRVH